MKKIFSIVALAAVMASCTDSKKEETTITNTDSISMDATNNSMMVDSTMMMSDTSHKMDKMSDTTNNKMDKMQSPTP